MPRWFLTSEASIRYLQSSTQQVQQKAFFKLLELARQDPAQAAKSRAGLIGRRKKKAAGPRVTPMVQSIPH